MRSQAETTELADLLARVAGGDQDAFAKFYDATSRIVFGIVLNVVRDRRRLRKSPKKSMWTPEVSTALRPQTRNTKRLAQHHRAS